MILATGCKARTYQTHTSDARSVVARTQEHDRGDRAQGEETGDLTLLCLALSIHYFFFLSFFLFYLFWWYWGLNSRPSP
jgi:hypothetical protein